ncbi:hypothetical protein PN497_15890 [Sphaerospermopsis kisseleviana CS-549]|uniref:Uncharacterized protein n=1 Tax=Sphaerospermopsis kisseleviana CS-549 TaxID=3021783 RepID=A0ABT4ZTT2_9CYAN|nr:hypothetical protein [Sphaerospermopsis kisseleviana]MDB9442832.1 hypothetical protein [Sphaerospermopsis kisseleviana CS-549]BAZ81396.1 hypothetical protein NIES73_26640 [Sphaerospermopsis kisseleviana NIES-73]
MTTIQPGEFWLADIPFTSGVSSKKRPVQSPITNHQSPATKKPPGWGTGIQVE